MKFSQANRKLREKKKKRTDLWFQTGGDWGNGLGTRG